MAIDVVNDLEVWASGSRPEKTANNCPVASDSSLGNESANVACESKFRPRMADTAKFAFPNARRKTPERLVATYKMLVSLTSLSSSR